LGPGRRYGMAPGGGKVVRVLTRQIEKHKNWENAKKKVHEGGATHGQGRGPSFRETKVLKGKTDERSQLHNLFSQQKGGPDDGPTGRRGRTELGGRLVRAMYRQVAEKTISSTPVTTGVKGLLPTGECKRTKKKPRKRSDHSTFSG